MSKPKISSNIIIAKVPNMSDICIIYRLFKKQKNSEK